MKKQSLYRELAKYYDLIYSWKNYKKEVNKINKLIIKYKKSDGKELLEVGCGTGQHLKYFKQNFSCAGIDVNQEILDEARRKIKNVKFTKANMVNFKLNKKFDVITCLFSSVGYVKTYGNLRKTIHNFANHLKTGGVVIIEPWFTKTDHNVGTFGMTTYQDKTIKIVRIIASKIKGKVSEMDMHYLIAERNKGVKYFVDRHELGLFGIDKTLSLMKETGLKSKFLKKGLMKGRGLYIGVKE